MVKKYVPFPNSQVDQLVNAYFKKIGIDINYVKSYKLLRGSGEPTMIEIELFFDDVPAQVDVTGIDKLETEYLPHG